jgi:hypothetical protein
VWSSLKSAGAPMARGLAERFGAVVMRLRNREIGVHIAELVIHEVRLLTGSAVALHPKARVADEDFVNRNADRNCVVRGWRIGQRGLWRFLDAVWTHVALHQYEEQHGASRGA